MNQATPLLTRGLLPQSVSNRGVAHAVPLTLNHEA